MRYDCMYVVKFISKIEEQHALLSFWYLYPELVLLDLGPNNLT